MEDKTFELLTKMYSEFSGKIDNMHNEFNSKFDNMQGKIDSIEGKIENIEGDLNSLKNVVTRMENDHGNKLDALFDGYKQINDRLDRIETEVSKHEEVILKRVR